MSTFFLKIGAAIHSSWSSVIYFIGLSLGDSSRATLDPKRWAKVICRLDLYIDPNAPPAIGTGFFLNVPGATKDVLVTAGHNLIRPPKSPGDKPQRTQQIEVRLYDSDGNPTTEKAEPSDYHIAAPYEQSQTPENAVHDYGIILLDRPIVDGKLKPREAFGFDIVLAAMDLQSKELGTNLIAFVGGYPGILNKTPTSEFRQGSGTFGRHKDRQVLYHAGTDQGMSGAPIWVNYDGEEVVVGIHNNHEEVKGEGNRGTRLEIRTMQDICKWTGADLGLLDKSIMVNDTKDSTELSHKELYIQLGSSDTSSSNSPPLGHARSGIGRDTFKTTFDIIHAKASPTYAPSKHPQFALVNGRATGSPRFLQFNTDPSAAPRQIIGVESISSACLVQFQYEKSMAQSDQIAAHPFNIVMSPHHKDLSGRVLLAFKVVLAPGNIPPVDNTFGLPLESLGLLLRAKRYRPGTKGQTDYDQFVKV